MKISMAKISMTASRYRFGRTIVLGLLVTATLGGIVKNARADAELRLYEGSYEWDLKDRVLIRTQDGTAFDYQYRKVCSAYNGCKAERTNSEQDAKLENLAAADFSALNTAIANLSGAGTPVAATPAKPSLCTQFARFVYEVKDQAGKTVKTEEITNCAGTRLPDSNALTIERVLNVAAGFAGL